MFWSILDWGDKRNKYLASLVLQKKIVFVHLPKESEDIVLILVVRLLAVIERTPPGWYVRDCDFSDLQEAPVVFVGVLQTCLYTIDIS